MILILLWSYSLSARDTLQSQNSEWLYDCPMGQFHLSKATKGLQHVTD